MRALSIRQPWAWLVVNGYKDIENRTWSTEFRGRVYVHAGQRMEPDDYPEQREHIGRAGIVVPARLARGAIVGEVTITAAFRSATVPGFAGHTGSCWKTRWPTSNPYPTGVNWDSLPWTRISSASGLRPGNAREVRVGQVQQGPAASRPMISLPLAVRECLRKYAAYRLVDEAPLNG